MIKCSIYGCSAHGRHEVQAGLVYCDEHQASDTAATQRYQERATRAHYRGVTEGKRDRDLLIAAKILPDGTLDLPPHTIWGARPEMVLPVTVRKCAKNPLLIIEDAKSRATDGLRGWRAYVDVTVGRSEELNAIYDRLAPIATVAAEAPKDTIA